MYRQLFSIIILLLFSASYAFPQTNGHKKRGAYRRTQNASVAKSHASGNILTFSVRGVKFEMVRVMGGTFDMGGDKTYDACIDEKPMHSVTLDGFLIGRTEVTQELWEVVMNDNPSCFKGKTLPVEEVSWHDCKKFIHDLDSLTGRHFRLPTEAEWEYASVGADKSHGDKYSGSNSIDDVAWYDKNSGGKTHPVALKRANELGIYDMSGNVFEWCQDWYDDSYYGTEAANNPKGPANGSFRIRRGGCWESNARRCRSFSRYSSDPEVGGYGIGLRLALSE